MTPSKNDQGDQPTREASVQSDPAMQQQQNTSNIQPLRKGPTAKDAFGNEVPLTPAPRFHATEHVTRLAQRAVTQARNRDNPGIPQAATPEAKAKATWRPLPAGGLAQLMAELYPDDSDNPDAMADHYRDLFLLNQDLLRTDTDASPHQMVRVPA